MTRPGHIARIAVSTLLAGLLATGCGAQPTGDPPVSASGDPVVSASGDPVVTRSTGPASQPDRTTGGQVDLVDSDWFVAAEALGPGWSHRPERLGVPSWPWAQDDCPTYRDTDYPAQRHRRGAEQRRYHHGKSPGLALAVIEVYEPTWSQHAMADARRVVETCPRYRSGPGSVSFELLDPGVGGPDILLVRGQIDYPQSMPSVSYFLSVRRGETVATLSLPDPGSPAAARQTLSEMATALRTAG